MIDTALLRIMRYRSDYNKLEAAVPLEAMDKQTRAILEDFKKYFEMFPSHEVIDMSVFIPRFKQWHPTVSDEQFNLYVGILKNVDTDVDDDVRAGIVSELHELRLATAAANLVAKYQDGEVEDFAMVLGLLQDRYKMDMDTQKFNWVDMSDTDSMFVDDSSGGLSWRLQCLRDTMRPLMGGDFGIVAARPDAGKSSFIASEGVYLARQLPEDKEAIWCVNEGKADNLRARLYQAALGRTISELGSLTRAELIDKYREYMSRLSKFRILSIHDWHVGQVNALFENTEPGMIVFDMIDHIKGFNTEARGDLRLEEMYKWGRNKCIEFDCVGIATSQISNDGEGLQYPALGMLKDSKTGKQGACDWQLMIGRSLDPNLQGQRFLSLPKNKLRIDGKPQDPRCAVVFNPSKALYTDVPIGE